ncbi:MAG: PIG-L family deacetylase [Hyphomonadaceae bacterium]|nr:PIG-L family deacetylase [Hyphomonadaceae bacterium]
MTTSLQPNAEGDDPAAPRLGRSARGALWTLFYIVLLTACFLAVRRALGAGGADAAIAALRMIDAWSIAASLAWVVGVFAIILVMEQVALRRANAPLATHSRPGAAFVANAVSLGVGFGALSGAALRARHYASAGLDTAGAVYVASAVTLMSVLGGLFVASLGFALLPADTLRHPLYWRAAGFSALAALGVLLLLSGANGRTMRMFGRRIEFPNALELTGWIALGALDWLFSAAALYVLAPDALRGDFLSFSAMFAGAHLVAMTTGAPNGLGLFDAIVITSAGEGAASADITAALIVYRVTAFLTPVALGFVGLAFLEARRVREGAVGALHAGGRTHWVLQRLCGLNRGKHSGQGITKGRLFAATRTPTSTLAELTGNGGVIVLAPHPDDETLGCGGLIASCVAASVPVHVIFLTDGRRSHLGSPHWSGARLAATRKGEAIRAVAALGLGAEHLTFLGQADATLLFDRSAQRRAAATILDVASACKCTSLFTTWVHDPHPDHVATALVAQHVCAVRPQIKLVSYPIWGRFLPDDVPLRDRNWRAVRLNVDRFLPAKREALFAHRTQTTPLIADALVGLGPSQRVQGEFLASDEVFLE